MTQQQISTPSIIDIEDLKILSSAGYSSLGIAYRDPWDEVLTALETRSLDPVTVVAGMDGALSPNSGNPFITQSYQALRLESRGLVLIGPIGSNADFEGTMEGVFNTAIASLPTAGGVIAVMAGTYTFNSTVSLPKSVCIIGVHPLSVTIQGTGDFPVFDLVGDDSRLEFLTLENINAISEPVVSLTGIKSTLIGCRVSDYSLLGARLVGSKACVKSCLFESDSSGIWLQGVYQFVESCSFSGSLEDGVLRFENSMCSALSNFIRDSVTGASYIIPSPVCANNKLVANHLGTTAVNAAIDHGTGTVRYANTPDTPTANENNFLLALQNYTGQPILDSTEMVLSNHVAHDSSVDKDATSILSSLDLFTQWVYEERNWFLTSANPTFDSVGVPTFGVFSWVGGILTWPDFAISSLIPNKTWTVAAGSSPVTVDQSLVLDIDMTVTGAITPTIKSLPRSLVNPTDMHQFVLAFSPASGVLVWTKGYRLLTELTSFDIDGMPLPINRYIGIPTDPRNTPVMPPSFAIGDDLTEKLGSQSNLLHSLYEESNLWEYSSNSIDTFPKPGAWLDLIDGIPETPSHLIQVKGTTYGLFPNYGVYRWYRETVGGNPGAWGVLGSNPLGTGPFASMSLVGTSSLALLTCSGTIVIWDTDSLAWSTVAPSTSLTFPFPNVRSGSYDTCGQADFAFQSPYYSVFTLLDGRSLLYFQSLNTLVETARIFTETHKGTALLGRHLKDSGFNVARNNWIDTVDNGAYATLQGLPLFNMATPAVEIPPQMYSASINTVKWDTLKHESFSYDPFSNAFISVVTNSTGTFYVLGGGADSSKLLSVVTIGTTTGFTDFAAHGWLANTGYGGEVIVFGTTISTSAFTVIIGKVNSSGSLGSSPFTWTRTSLGGANSCKGSVGVIDRWNNQGSGDIHILASDLARSSRPTWWRYSRSAAAWTSATLAESGGSVTVAQAVASSFTYDASVDRQAGYGVASPSGIRFLVKDSARSGRPTMFAFNPSTSLYSGIRLSESVAPSDVIVTGADVNSITQVYGGLYQNAWDASIWVSRENSGNQIKVITYFASANVWNIMSVGSGGTHLNSLSLGTPSFTKRTGSLVGTPTLTTFVDSSSSRDIYVWTQSAGLLKGTITAYYLTGVPTATWTQHDKRMPSAIPVFSSEPMSTYSPTLAPSRCDLSVQIGSFAEKALPVYGAGLSATTGGIQWFEPGTKVKQITSTIWAGLNRNGYLWIGNPTFSSTQQELFPTGSTTVRGDIAVLNLGYTDDFDWAFNGSQSQIAFVYKDINNANRLGFILYDIATNSITHERGAGSGVVPLGGTPQIAYNSVSNSWSIVAQDATVPASNARLILFRRSAIASSWSPDESALASASGKNPSKPFHLADGSLLLATESGASFNLLISKRDYATGSWSSVYLSSGGGFKSPKLTVTSDGLRWWAFGGVDSSARIAWSSNPLSGWSIWSGSPTLSALAYTRITTPILLALTSSVIVASAATLDGAVPANREILIWRFENSGTAKVIGAFTSKGRIQSAVWSGEEEDGITDLSWTPDQKLIYGALRPTRSTLHWSLRGSTQSWSDSHGDSLLGSGRYLTLGNKHFREQWGSASGTGSGTGGTDLIVEYPSLTSWSVLPLALRTGETDFTSVRWPFSTSSGYLFTTGSPSAGISNDTGAVSGTLVTSASRGWPLILGNTRWSGLSHTGPGVFTQGSMLGLFPPTGSTNLTYFGNATIGSSNLFKIKAQAAITFNGTRIWSVGPSKQYILVGPITYLVDTSLANQGAHLVLEFNTSSSLVKDATENPLSYWLAIDHSSTKYAVVVAEAREQEMLLYPALGSRTSAQLLTYGHLEPIEILSGITSWQYSIPYRLDVVPAYEIATISGTSLSLKEIGSLRGTQPSILSISKQQISMRRLLPNEGCFLFQTISSSVNSSSSRTSALATLTSSIVTIDKLNGEMT